MKWALSLVFLALLAAPARSISPQECPSPCVYDAATESCRATTGTECALPQRSKRLPTGILIFVAGALGYTLSRIRRRSRSQFTSSS